VGLLTSRDPKTKITLNKMANQTWLTNWNSTRRVWSAICRTHGWNNIYCTHFISSDLISSELSTLLSYPVCRGCDQSECSRPCSRVLTGHSRGGLGRFSVHSVEKRWDEWYEHSLRVLELQFLNSLTVYLGPRPYCWMWALHSITTHSLCLFMSALWVSA